MSVCSFVQSQSAPSSSQSPSSSSQPANVSTLNEKPILTLKTSPKQVLMMSSSRLSVSPGCHTPDPTHSYSSKKSPTILILSKPKNELSAKPLVHKPPKSSSNLISSYFNKQSTSGSHTSSPSPNVRSHHLPIQFMPNSKPITLIPIGKFATNSNASNFGDNFNSLIPIETIEISTATIEINSTNESSGEIKAEPKAEPIEPPAVRQELVEAKPEPCAPKIDVTRCICQMDHDDGFMICCDSCLVWQHIACMEVNKKKIPDKFYCEKCNPRAVNVQRARQIQEKYLKNVCKTTNKPKSRRASNSSSAAAMTPSGDCESIEESLDDTSVLSPADSDPAECRRHKKRLKSRTIREQLETKKPDDADKQPTDSLDPLDADALDLSHSSSDLLKLAKAKSSKRADDADDPKYRVKLAQSMPKERIVCEYAGEASFGECEPAHPFSYTFALGPHSTRVSIDSSKSFNNSRYIRKSCRPNVKLVPVKNATSNLKFFLQTAENVAKNAEIFLPADATNTANSVCVCDTAECELRQREVSGRAAAKKSAKRPERRVSCETLAAHDDTAKCLSREDRKLASYVRVIEKLEKQVKRKKETVKAEPLLKCVKEPNEKENDKHKKCKSARPSLLLNKQRQEQRQEPLMAEPVDQEIASINERPALEQQPKAAVKSPDYSFVNLSIQPRHTLDLLQRNLTTGDERFSPPLESLENNQTFLTNKSFFHPKKHWLKTCCSSEPTDLSPSKSDSSQPPKKRRFVVEPSPSDTNTVRPHSQQPPLTPPSPPMLIHPVDQFYMGFVPSAAILNAPFFAPNAFYQYAALSMYQQMMPVGGQSSEGDAQAEGGKKKVSLAEYRQRKESVKHSDGLFESISSSKSFSNDDSLCELDVYPSEAKGPAACLSCSSRCSRNASLSDISDVSSVRSASPSASSQTSHLSRLESYHRGLKRKYRSCSASRLLETQSTAARDGKRSCSAGRTPRLAPVRPAKCVPKHSLSKSFSSSSSICSLNYVSKAHL